MNQKFINLLKIKDSDALFKKCIKKVPINKSLYTYPEVEGYRNQVGMVIPDGFIVVDVDNKEDAELLTKILDFKQIKCIINRTQNGKHFIFRNSKKISQGSHMMTPIAISLDIRSPGKGYIILPEGADSVVGMLSGTSTRSYEVLPESLDNIPSWLIPNKHLNSFFKNETLRGCENSRDDTIFKYIMYLKDYTDYGHPEVVEICEIINNYLFYDPLDFSGVIYPKIKPDDFKHNRRKVSKQERIVEMAKEIIIDYKIKKRHQTLFFYDGSKYTAMDNASINGIILHEYDEYMKRVDRGEACDFISDYVLEEPESNISSAKSQIATPTQVVDLKTLEVYPNNGSIFNVNNIQFDYNATLTENKFVDDYMKSLFDSDEEINLIYEMIGYGMLSYSPFRKSFYLIGPAKRGKSFFLDIVRTIFGEESIASIDPIDIANDSRMAGGLNGKLLNIPDDIELEEMKKEALFKKMISGESIQIDQKYQKDNLKFRPTATFMFTANYAPKFKNTDDGIYSRLVFIRFKKKIKNIMDFIDQWNATHYEYIVYKSINAIHNALNNGQLTIPQANLDDLNEFKINDSPTLQFMASVHNSQLPDKYLVTRLYSEYKDWCSGAGYNYRSILQPNEFKDEICRNFSVRTKQTSFANDTVDTGNKMRYINEE